jgi:putative transposase
LELARSSYYYQPAEETEENLELMRLLDEQYLETPYYGSRRMTAWLRRQGYEVNRKRIRRLMAIMDLEPIYPRPKTTLVNPDHKIYPYLLRGVTARHPDHIWGADITYIPMCRGFMYLVAILDWYSRYALAWEVSNTLEQHFCIQALERALESGRPEVFNTDQGVQFTSVQFVGRLARLDIQISMNGRGRALDNVFIERLWRSVKYENVYLNDYGNGLELYKGLEAYFHHYNTQRPHQALGYRVPIEVYRNLGQSDAQEATENVAHGAAPGLNSGRPTGDLRSDPAVLPTPNRRS